MVTVGIVAGLGVWFGLSVLNQYKRGQLIRRLKQRDLFSLIPIWTFFAPRPGVTDFNILYRDTAVDGSCGPWRELDGAPSPWCKGLWNPGKRVRKGTTDMCNTLLRVAAQRPGKRMYVQLSYLTLLHHACQAPRTELSFMRQFAVVRTFGYETEQEPMVLFVSGLHRLDDAPGDGTAGDDLDEAA